MASPDAAMEPGSGVAEFENERWRTFVQPREFRHDAARSLITSGPVLDIGCGDGLLLSLLAEQGIAAEGVDISVEAIERCHARGLSAKQYDPLQPLPFADHSFETVVLLDVLEHVYDPAALLKEAARVGRVVIVSVPNFSSLPARLQVLRGRVPENNQPNKGHLYWFNRPVLSQISAAAGLQETAVRMNTFRPVTKLPALLRALPNLCALSFVVRLEPLS